MEDFSNTVDWPMPHTNRQHTQISTVLMLAILDEAVTPGSFQDNMSKACQDNGLPDVTYNLQPNTAQAFFKACTGQTPDLFHDIHKRQRSKGTLKRMKSTMSKYSRDQLKNLGQSDYSTDADTISYLDYSNQRKDLQHKVRSKTKSSNAKSNIYDSTMTSSVQPQDTKYLFPETPQSLITDDLNSNSKKDDLCNDSGKTVDPYSEYLRHLNDTFITECNKDLDSRIPTISSLSQSKVAYISDSDSDY